ncbi:MAG TPA: cytidylate kinase-like family protein [Verrucomicrobiae bacterium]|nr:cytidylate kinase-like family protein [Verrucomicrobiae bacterium]
MIKIIVIEREFGTGASVIAEKLAQRLGWRLLDQQLTGEIARLAKVSEAAVKHCEERLDPLFYRLAKVFWRGSYERSLPVTGLETFDADQMMQFMQRIIGDAAAAGNCVIVGRGAPYFLRDRSDTLVVFLFAPRELKIRRALALCKNEAEASEIVDTVDQQRVAFVKHYFGKDWPHRPLYDAMLNTALGEDITTDAIVSLMNAINKKKGSS